MDSVGVRELKTHLSHHLKRVQAGKRLLVTERGRVIASISPVEAPADVGWAHQLVAAGQAHWAGGKPKGTPRPVAVSNRRTVSAAILEDRR